MKRILLILAFLLVAHPALSQIAFVQAGNVTNTTSAFFTASYTVNASTTLLVLAVVTDPTVDCTLDTITWNSVSMTADANTKRNPADSFCSLAMYHLANPATGTHNFQFTANTAILWVVVAAEYSGAGTMQPDNTGTAISANASDASLNSSLTTMADNAWVVEAEAAYFGNNPSTAGTGLTSRICGPDFGEPCIFDSNAAVHPAGSYSMTVNGPAGSNNYISLVNTSFAPSGGATSHPGLLLGVFK